MDPCLRFYHLLKHVTCSTEQQITQVLNDADVTLPQAMILLHIAEGARTMSDLSKSMCCSSGNVTQLMDQLLRKKLLVRFPCKDDRRVQHVKLTAAGSNKLQKIAGALEKKAHGCFKNLTVQEQRAVMKILKKF